MQRDHCAAYLIVSVLLFSIVLPAWSNHWIPDVTDIAEIKRMFETVRNRDIQFATMSDPHAKRREFERRIVITAPPQLVRIAAMGDVRILDVLIEFLDDPNRAWTAEVALAAMTRHDEAVVNAYSDSPHEWLRTLGSTAQAQWKEWLNGSRDRLSWDSEKHQFIRQTIEDDRS